MDKIILEATSRTVTGKANRHLRREGRIPAVAYGHDMKPELLSLETKVAEKVYTQAGSNKIVSLKVGDDKAKNVLMYDVQRDGTRGTMTHADLYIVRMDEVLHTEIPVHFTGESTAVYQDEGTLVKNLETIEVECLPADLPDMLEVDISSLDDFEKTITVGDIKVPKGVKLLIEDLETVVAKVDPPRSDEEMAELDEPIDEAAEIPENAREEDPAVVSEESGGDADRGRDKK